MRRRAWWNKAHYGNENTGCYNNLYRKAACTREGQCSITVIRDSNSVPQYEEEQQECWTFCCTRVETDSSFTVQDPGCWQPTQKACAIPHENPAGQLSSTTTSWQHWSKNKVCLSWGRSDTRRRPCILQILFSTHQHKKWHYQKSCNTNVKWWPRKVMLNFIRSCKRIADNLNVCKRMVSHRLTFKNSWGCCKKKVNIKNWNLSNSSSISILKNVVLEGKRINPYSTKTKQETYELL